MLTKFNYAGMAEIVEEMTEICNKLIETAEEMKKSAMIVSSSGEWVGQASEYYMESLKNIDDIIFAIQINLASAIYYEQLVIDQHKEYETIIINGGIRK